jgi:hypothetical protein
MMSQLPAKRPGEIAVEHPQSMDASLQYIGSIHTPPCVLQSVTVGDTVRTRCNGEADAAVG